MKLADWLKRERLTHEQGAKRIGCDRSTLSRILPGEDGAPPARRPGWKLLPKIVRATNGEVTANDFMDADPASGVAEVNADVNANPSRNQAA